MPRKSHTGKTPKGGKSEETKAAESVSREVKALGKELAATLRAVADSDELKAVGNELTHSLQRVSEKVVQAVKTAGSSQRPKAVGDQLGKVVETGRKRSMEAGERIRVNLATGLREIGQELGKLARRLDK